MFERNGRQKIAVNNFTTIITGNHETFQSVQLKEQKTGKNPQYCLFYAVISVEITELESKGS